MASESLTPVFRKDRNEDSYCSINSFNDPFEALSGERAEARREGDLPAEPKHRFVREEVGLETPNYWDAQNRKKSFEMLEQFQTKFNLDDAEVMLPEECSSKHLDFTRILVNSASADAQGPYERSLSNMASPDEQDNKYLLKLTEFEKSE